MAFTLFDIKGLCLCQNMSAKSEGIQQQNSTWLITFGCYKKNMIHLRDMVTLQKSTCILHPENTYSLAQTDEVDG